MRMLIAIVSLALLLGSAGDAAAQGPVRIGFISPLSGAIAQAGKDMYSGCELYWEETGWQRAGRRGDQGPRAGRIRSSPHAGGRDPLQRRLRAGALHRGPGHTHHLPDQL